jgi:hypothetical protein
VASGKRGTTAAAEAPTASDPSAAEAPTARDPAAAEAPTASDPAAEARNAIATLWAEEEPNALEEGGARKQAFAQEEEERCARAAAPRFRVSRRAACSRDAGGASPTRRYHRRAQPKEGMRRSSMRLGSAWRRALTEHHPSTPRTRSTHGLVWLHP